MYYGIKIKAYKYIIIIFPLLLIFNTNCNKEDGNSVPADNTRNFIVGVGPIWKLYYGELEDQPVPTPTLDTIRDMMPKIIDSGQMVLAQTGWRAGILGDVPSYFNDLINIWPSAAVLDTAVNYEYVSYGINFFDQGTGVPQVSTPADSDNDWTNNADAPAKYQQAALALCKAPYYAKYIAIALEVNTYCHYYQADYIYFIENVYIPIYDAIKQVDSSIYVFVTFQLEQCKGLGDESVWGYLPASHWSLLDYYNGKLDLMAFTTYPEFIYGSPDQIPGDYYKSIIDNLPAGLKTKPLAFVEMGWSDKDGNAVSRQAQVDFLNRFLLLTAGLNVEYVNCVFLHDEHSNPVNPKFKLGLIDYFGNKRSVWDEWEILRDRKYVHSIK